MMEGEAGAGTALHQGSGKATFGKELTMYRSGERTFQADEPNKCRDSEEGRSLGVQKIQRRLELRGEERADREFRERQGQVM